MRRLLPLLLLPACEADTDVVADMERALVTSHEALTGQLVSVELLSHHDEEPSTLRHGSSCGCPCLETLGSDTSYVLSLDYDETGCLPTSELIPVVLAGHATIDVDGSTARTASFEALSVNLDAPVSGSVVGDVLRLSPDAQRLVLVSDLTLGDLRVEQELTAVLGADGVELDGRAVVTDEAGTATLLFDDVVLPAGNAFGACADPDQGTITWLGERHDVVIDMAGPGEGMVLLSRDGQPSDPTDYCSYKAGPFY